MSTPGSPEPPTSLPPSPPTDEQRRALEATVSVALSSGAGCGKTRVLTDRFVLALERRTPLDRIVAVTFTEKAASEMRDRIRKECRRRIASATGADAAYWRRVLRGLEAGRIGTFHGFCLDLLKRFAVQAGLPPDFAVLEESLAPTLRDESLRSCFRRWLAGENEDLVMLAVELGLDAVREGLRSLLLGRTLAEPGRWAELRPEDLMAHWLDAWHSEGRPAVLRRFVDDAGPLLELLEAHPCEHPVGAERRSVLLCEIPLLPEAPHPDLSFETIKEHAAVAGGGTGRHWPSIDVYNAVRDHYKKIRDAVDRSRKALLWDEALTRRSAELGVRFARLAREALEEVDALKRRREFADFDDLLGRTRSLLSEGGDGLLDGLRGEIALLLVDEFQDTDPVQGAIVEAIAGDDPSSARLFLVGDSKQSIYRFRGAEPKIFDRFRSGLLDGGRLSLTGNFRSVPGVIDFVNALFGDLYADPSEALRAERDVPTDPDRPPAVEFLWAYEPESSGRSKASNRRVEAGWIARLIADRLDRGWPIQDPKSGAWRDAAPPDVAILFRALTTVGVYEEALANEGLDYHTVDGSAFFAQQEVLDVVNLLAAIEDPFDPLSLAAALRSPVFGLSDEGLYWLANARPDDRPSDLLQNLRRSDPVPELSRGDRRRAIRARDRLERWRALKDRAPIATLLDRVLDESGFEAAIAAEPLGDRKRANVRKVVRLAGDYDRGGYPLADFVARLRADLRQLAREDQAATNTEQGDAVRLMTIHRAKGLEFPIVIVPDLDRGSPPTSRSVVVHDRFGPIVRIAPEPGEEPTNPGSEEDPKGLGDLLHRASEEREERAEADRLFYVAATRAVSRLILSNGLDRPMLLGPPGREPPGQKFYRPLAPAMERIHARFDLASGSLKATLPAGWPEPRVSVIARSPERQSPRGGPIRPRADRLSIVRAIGRARPGSSPDRVPAPARPTWIEHELEDGLAPFAARVHRLVLAVLCDPDAAWSSDLALAIDRAARATIPASPPRVVEAARYLIDPWLGGDLARRVGSAEERRGQIRWTVTGEGDGPDSAGVVHRGRLDLAFREGKTWRLVSWEHPASPSGVSERRLVLSIRAAPGLGLGRIGAAWLVSLGGGPIEQALDVRRVSRTIPVETPPTPPRTRSRPARRPSAGTRPTEDPDDRS
ncbi:UvrD-helicase domain-containing protein [Tautonia plasticadhaerens]|uniref:DNA 3'-5' helicase n=1 Tax=Tautonia plasticadhaerens TaxID=2527974 RepID=A0A518GXH3_9BACT|nr:UvrD-helicase domain-containing protein [Tautonia plasticadhaerens]QDV33262.1 ATP-dependent helicase/nuclease subunit A [Tautonia plasticadhaerens]